MVIRHLPLVVLALLLLAAPARAAGKTTVDGHHLDNTSVGFYGFTVDIPLEYEPYTPPQEKDFKPKTYADLAWLKASQLDRNAGYTTIDCIPFQNKNCGLVTAVLSSVLAVPPVKQEKQHLRYLDGFMSWKIPHTANDFVRDIRKIGNINVGRAGFLQDKSAQVIYVVLIPPSTILTFYGVGPASAKDTLTQDLDAVIATLNIGKRPKLP